MPVEPDPVHRAIAKTMANAAPWQSLAAPPPATEQIPTEPHNDWHGSHGWGHPTRSHHGETPNVVRPNPADLGADR